MDRAVIILGGRISDYVFAKKLINGGDYIICADSGLYHAEKMGIAPNLAIGDFDSYRDNGFLDSLESAEVMRFPADKNETDGHLAVLSALKRGAGEILLLGALGGERADHIFANVMLLRLILENKANGIIIDEQNEIRLVDTTLTFGGMQYFSVLPFLGGACVSIDGAKYPLNRERMNCGDTLGVSNEFLDGAPVTISVEDGIVMLVITKN